MTGDYTLVLSAEAQMRLIRSFAADVLAAYPDRPAVTELVVRIADEACQGLMAIVRDANRQGLGD